MRRHFFFAILNDVCRRKLFRELKKVELRLKRALIGISPGNGIFIVAIENFGRGNKFE